MSKKAKRLSTPTPRFEEFSIILQRLIIVLAVLFSVSALSAYNLYVDASADSLGADGSVNHPYPSIQQAINHAFDDNLPVNTTSPKVKVFISSNVYSDSLNINFEDPNHESHFVQDLSLVGQGNGFELIPNRPTAIQLNGTTESTLKIQKCVLNGISGIPENEHRTFLNVNSENMKTLDIHECIINGVSTVINVNSSSMDSLILNSCEINVDAIYVEEEITYYESYVIRSTSTTFINDISIINNKIFDSYTNPYHLARISLFGDKIEFKNNVCKYIELNFISDTYNNLAKFEKNSFNNSPIIIKSSNSKITNNTFYCNPEYDPIYRKAITASNTWHYPIKININRNIFWNCESALKLQPASTMSITMANCHTLLSNNSFFDCDHASIIEHNSFNPYTIHDYKNNVFYGQSNTPFLITGNYYVADPIPISYSYFNAALSPDPRLDIDEASMVYGAPYIQIDYDQHSYELLWDYEVKSPLINAGCPEYISASAPERASDPDGTRPDIGAVYYPHNHREYKFTRIDQSGIFWRCFPVIDDRSQTDDHYWNETGMFFGQYMTGAPYGHCLETVAWSYDGEPGSMSYEDIGNNWVNDDYAITQPKGFKIQFRDTNQGSIPPLLVDGFKADPTQTAVDLCHFDDNGGDFPNWIGYFVPYTQSVESAFSKPVPEDPEHTYLDYIYWIKTQSWLTSREYGNAGGDWIIRPHLLTLSEGDMVEVKLLKDITFDLNEMYWYALGEDKEPYVRAIPEGFNFTELLDYSPIFIEFDPENTPNEVGVFVGNKCYGAAVVDAGTIEVNLYYQADDAKSDDEISFMFYYADKSLKKAPAPLVYNPDTLLFETGSLKAKQIKDFGYVSYLKGEGGTMAPLLTQLNTNYPNPFRDKTNISYILEKEAKISVEIYNLKGQKVKTLYSGMGKKGKHGISWDSTDSHGKKVASGVYFCRLSTPDSIQSQKMLLMK